MRALIGTTALGTSNVKLYSDSTTGSGCFSTSFSGGDLPYITVGLDHYQWWSCLAILHHEVNEFVLMCLNRRYQCAEEMANSKAAYTFIMTHEEFAEMCAQSAYFISRMYAPLYKAWKSRNDKPKAKAKAKKG